MGNWLVGVGFVLGLGLAAGGCSSGGGGGGGSGGTGGASSKVTNAAVAATVATLQADLQNRGSLLSAGISVGVVTNPNAIGTSGSFSLPMGANPNDGTVASIDVTTVNPLGPTAVTTLQVSDSGTGDVFLGTTTTWAAPTITVCDAPLGYTGLASDGTGPAFVLARVEQTATVSVTFINQPAAVTLIDFTGVSPAQPDGTYTGSFTTINEWLFEYDVTNPGGVLTAQVVTSHPWSREYVFNRTGGPVATAVAQAVTTLTLGAQAFDASVPLSIPVGTDADPLGVPLAAAATVRLTVTGGVGSTYDTSFVSGLSPTLVGIPGPTPNYTLGTVSVGLAGNVNNGIVEASDALEIVTISPEDPTAVGSVQHTLGIMGGYPVESLLYLPSNAETRRSLRYFH